MTNNIEKIEKYKDLYPQLCHASNILTKYEENNNIPELLQIIDKYIVYIDKNLELTGYDDEVIQSRVNLLNEYYNFLHFNGWDNLYKSQSKFRPTILEEFLFLLFNDYVTEYKVKYGAEEYLDSGSVKAYSNLYFNAQSFSDFIQHPSIAVNEKDQDFAIFRRFTLNVNGGKSIDLQVPAVAIEAKTFIDKTMLDGIIATAEKVKNGNPYTMFISVTETYDVAFKVDPAYSRIDQIYVLRKTTRKSSWQNIDSQVVLRMFHEIKAHLERPWSDVQNRLINDGVIL